LPLARWRQIGVTNLKGGLLAEEPTEGALFLPAGYKGPAFITLDNFRVFLRYNNSTPYALGAGYLGDVLMGGDSISAPWPRDERTLTLTERKELQTLLNQLGYNVGTPDGIIGAGTRAGLRQYQKKEGVPADGFATASILQRMRKDAGDATPATPSAPAPTGDAAPAPSSTPQPAE
jgi:membrane-bound lytic murein transglycosylase B